MQRLLNGYKIWMNEVGNFANQQFVTMLLLEQCEGTNMPQGSGLNNA